MKVPQTASSSATAQLPIGLPKLPVGWPKSVKVRQTYRSDASNSSRTPYGDFNLALHVADNPAAVLTHRAHLLSALGVDQIHWVNQIHSTQLQTVWADYPLHIKQSDADAMLTDQASSALAIMSADCLPLVLTDAAGEQVAVIHAGWRGLLGGIIERVAAQMSCPAYAYIGAAIQQANFEVGLEVREAFIAADASYGEHFVAAGDKFLGDLPAIARAKLDALGVSAVCDPRCTVSFDAFYSYRRDRVTGRMALLAWRV